MLTIFGFILCTKVGSHQWNPTLQVIRKVITKVSLLSLSLSCAKVGKEQELASDSSPTSSFKLWRVQLQLRATDKKVRELYIFILAASAISMNVYYSVPQPEFPNRSRRSLVIACQLRILTFLHSIGQSIFKCHLSSKGQNARCNSRSFRQWFFFNLKKVSVADQFLDAFCKMAAVYKKLFTKRWTSIQGILPCTIKLV